MDDRKALLKSMLQNFINGNEDGAKTDCNQYLALRAKEIAGVGVSQEQQTAIEKQENQED